MWCCSSRVCQGCEYIRPIQQFPPSYHTCYGCFLTVRGDFLPQAITLPGSTLSTLQAQIATVLQGGSHWDNIIPTMCVPRSVIQDNIHPNIICQTRFFTSDCRLCVISMYPRPTMSQLIDHVPGLLTNILDPLVNLVLDYLDDRPRCIHCTRVSMQYCMDCGQHIHPKCVYSLDTETHCYNCHWTTVLGPGCPHRGVDGAVITSKQCRNQQCGTILLVCATCEPVCTRCNGYIRPCSRCNQYYPRDRLVKCDGCDQVLCCDCCCDMVICGCRYTLFCEYCAYKYLTVCNTCHTQCCLDCSIKCNSGDHISCPDCISICPFCSNNTCIKCLLYCTDKISCGRRFCLNCQPPECQTTKQSAQ